jgi:hypothetical protein
MVHPLVGYDQFYIDTNEWEWLKLDITKETWAIISIDSGISAFGFCMALFRGAKYFLDKLPWDEFNTLFGASVEKPKTGEY